MWWLQRRLARRQDRFAVVSVFAVLAITGCANIEMTDKIDYRSAAPPKPLDIPPDLSQLPKEDRYQVPGAGANTASAANAANAARGAQAAAPTTGNVIPAVTNARFERDGSQRWLAVDQPPEQVIEQVREMFKTVGLGIVRDDPTLGIVETVWAENHAKLPLDFLRKALGKVTDFMYSTSELDKFRARIERTQNNTSEVFISHRGMAEVYTNSQHENTIWQVRPSDPELEAEMLRRLQLRFAPATATAATTTTATTTTTAAATPIATEPKAPPPPQNARLVKGDSPADSKVLIDEPFDRAWRRVGLALDRGGFTVEDRDRTKGLYFVRYLDPEYEAKIREQQGFFSKMFGRDSKIDAQQFRILVAATTSGTDVTVQDKDGKAEAGATGVKILAQITEQLR